MKGRYLSAMKLSKSQKIALENITKYARKHRADAQRTIGHILKMSNISEQKFEKAVAKLKAHARVGLHFHPDRPNLVRKSVVESLLEYGFYTSQFETGISSGSVSAFPGGERDLWEERIFQGAYQNEETTNRQRPKYGALNLMNHPDGPAPRFGSCYFLLSPKVSYRATFTYLDSHQDPKEKGTYEEFDMILAALLEEAFIRDFAIGERDLTPVKLVNHLLVNIEKEIPNPSKQQPNRNLNHYIEAQIHGDISLKDDVDILVADPSFKGTYIGSLLEQICLQYSIELLWHQGFTLLVDEVPSDFRGPSMPSVAKRVASQDLIDASMIGSAVLELHADPDSWSDRGSYKDVLQELKLLWHVLVKYGKPFTN